MLSVLGFKIDGGWVDLGSMCSGALWVIKQSYQRRSIARRESVFTAPMLGKQAGFDFATGASLFPFILLALSPFSSELLTGLLQGGKVVLAVAGIIALASIVRDS